MKLTWLDLPCPDCGAIAGEDCFASSRLGGKIASPMHPERILAVIRTNYRGEQAT